MYIYYDSRTGNVQRFIQKISLLRSWYFVRITHELRPEYPGHLITYTTNFGDIPPLTSHFMKEYAGMIKSVSVSGNRNWGKLFGRAGDKISKKYEIPLFAKFELSGLPQDVESLINRIEESEK